MSKEAPSRKPVRGRDREPRREPSPLAEIGAIIDAIVAETPEEEWAKLPVDMADTVDMKLYGRPK